MPERQGVALGRQGVDVLVKTSKGHGIFCVCTCKKAKDQRQNLGGLEAAVLLACFLLQYTFFAAPDLMVLYVLFLFAAHWALTIQQIPIILSVPLL